MTMQLREDLASMSLVDCLHSKTLSNQILKDYFNDYLQSEANIIDLGKRLEVKDRFYLPTAVRSLSESCDIGTFLRAGFIVFLFLGTERHSYHR